MNPRPRRNLLKAALAVLASAGAFFLGGAALGGGLLDEPQAITPTGFAFEKSVVVPGTPEEVFDAFTGDVSGWWDHHYSEEPKALYIEAKPGGGFYEIFDEAGNGALHAAVTHANRGKQLQFTGALGLASLKGPIHMVHTFEFKAEPEGNTTIELRVAAVGEFPDGMGAIVQSVWDHFLDGQFKPWVEAGKHK